MLPPVEADARDPPSWAARLYSAPVLQSQLRGVQPADTTQTTPQHTALFLLLIDAHQVFSAPRIQTDGHAVV